MANSKPGTQAVGQTIVFRGLSCFAKSGLSCAARMTDDKNRSSVPLIGHLLGNCERPRRARNATYLDDHRLRPEGGI